jgi:hypothetical protein
MVVVLARTCMDALRPGVQKRHMQHAAFAAWDSAAGICLVACAAVATLCLGVASSF